MRLEPCGSPKAVGPLLSRALPQHQSGHAARLRRRRTRPPFGVALPARRCRRRCAILPERCPLLVLIGKAIRVLHDLDRPTATWDMTAGSGVSACTVPGPSWPPPSVPASICRP